MSAAVGGMAKDRKPLASSQNFLSFGKKAGQAVKPVDHQPQYLRDALSMYAAPPVGEVTIENFERYAMDRLRGAPASPANRLACHTLSLHNVLQLDG